MMGRPNWKDNTIWTGDNLHVMRGMNSESVDLIYLDPPFNSDANYAAPIGSPAEGAEFPDIFTLDNVKAHWIDEIQNKNPKVFKVIQAASTNSGKAYLAYMAPRIMQMHRILRGMGSIFLHCDPHMSHYLKATLDAIFGPRNFLNEIVWCYTGPTRPGRWMPRKHDTIFWYSKSGKHEYNQKAIMISSKWNKFGGFDKRKGQKAPDSKIPMKAQEDWIVETFGPNSKERTGYPTQKPESLLKKFILMASKEGQRIFDPFCGCATAPVVADEHGRNWIGIDISPKAAELVMKRIRKKRGLFEKIIHRTDKPRRTDQGKIKRYNHPDNRDWLYGKQGGNCKGCKHHFRKRNLTIDHIVPVSEGGGDELENLQMLCAACNSVKGNRGMEYLMKVLDMDRDRDY